MHLTVEFGNDPAMAFAAPVEVGII